MTSQLINRDQRHFLNFDQCRITKEYVDTYTMSEEFKTFKLVKVDFNACQTGLWLVQK